MTNDLKTLVTRHLQALGWNTEDGSAIARKSFNTAVGLKAAVVYLAASGSEHFQAILTADYQSEGRNILSTCIHFLPEGASDVKLQQVVEKFAAECEQTVSQSYAAKLLVNRS